MDNRAMYSCTRESEPLRSRPRRRLHLAATALASLLVAALCACDSTDDPPVDPENAIKLLACNPLTGSLSFMGAGLERSMGLAAREINDAGGIWGRPLQLIQADTHSDEEAGLAEARFYYERQPEIAGIVGASLDSVSKRLLVDLAKNRVTYGRRVPIVSPASTSAEFVGLLDAQYNLFFRSVCSSHLEGRILANKASEMGFSVGAAVGLRDINNKEIFKTFRQRFDQLGDGNGINVYYYNDANIVDVGKAFDQAFADTEQRYGKKPQFLLVLAYGNDGKFLLNQWARKRPETPLLLSDSLMSDYFMSSMDPQTLTELARGSVNGVFPGQTSAGLGAAMFARVFCEEYPQHCRCEAEDEAACSTGEGLLPGIYTANAYDAVYMLALGLAHAGLSDPAKVDSRDAWNLDAITQGILDGTNHDSTADVAVFPGEWQQVLQTLREGDAVNYEGSSATSLEVDLNGDPTNCSFTYWSIAEGKIVFTNSDGEKESVTISL